LWIAGAAAGDQFATSLAPFGDANGDGHSEIAAGSFRAASPSANGAGRVDLVDVANAGPVLDLAVPATTVATVFGSSASAQLGYGLAGGADVDGDGALDIFAGMRGYDSPAIDAGAAVLVRRTTSTPSTLDLGAPSPFVHEDRAGYACAIAGDVDHDGFPDLATGAINATPAGISAAGATYVMFGRVTDLALDVTIAGSALTGGVATLAFRGEPAALGFALIGTSIVLPPLLAPPHQYGIAVNPQQLAVIGPLGVLDANGGLTLAAPFSPAPILAGQSFAVQGFAAALGPGDFSRAYLVVLP
jgi:FG-GAP repeat